MQVLRLVVSHVHDSPPPPPEQQPMDVLLRVENKLESLVSGGDYIFMYFFSIHASLLPQNNKPGITTQVTMAFREPVEPAPVLTPRILILLLALSFLLGWVLSDLASIASASPTRAFWTEQCRT